VQNKFDVVLTVHRRYYVEIKCQLDATDEFFIADLIACSTCFEAPLCPSSGALEYYTSGCCLSYLVLGFQVVGLMYAAAARKPDTQPSAPHHTDNLKTNHQIRQATTTCIIVSSS
jgi:hypothetical protein